MACGLWTECMLCWSDMCFSLFVVVCCCCYWMMCWCCWWGGRADGSRWRCCSRRRSRHWYQRSKRRSTFKWQLIGCRRLLESVYYTYLKQHKKQELTEERASEQHTLAPLPAASNSSGEQASIRPSHNVQCNAPAQALNTDNSSS